MAYTWMSLLGFCSALFPLMLFLRRPDVIAPLPAFAGTAIVLTFSGISALRALDKVVPTGALILLDVVWTLSFILAFLDRPRIFSLPTQAEVEAAHTREATLKVELSSAMERLRALQEERDSAESLAQDKLRLVEAKHREQQIANDELRALCERH